VQYHFNEAIGDGIKPISKSDNKYINMGEEVRGMDLNSLKTRNEQVTMFSRQFRTN